MGYLSSVHASIYHHSLIYLGSCTGVICVKSLEELGWMKVVILTLRRDLDPEI